MLNKADQSRIILQLGQFGCSQAEAEIYLQSLAMGPSAVQELARKLRRNRVTVHSGVEQLIEKGFLCESRRGKRRLIVAEEPEVLSRLLQRKYNELKLMEANVDYTTRLLNSIRSDDLSRPAVKFYEGVEGFKTMLEETLQNNTRKKVFVFTYVDLFSSLIGVEYLEDYFVRRSAKGIRTRLIFPPCLFADRVAKKAAQYKIQVRLLPQGLKWRSGFFSWEDKVAIMSYTQNKLTTTIIENPDIATFFQNIIFELSWGVAK